MKNYRFSMKDIVICMLALFMAIFFILWRVSLTKLEESENQIAIGIEDFNQMYNLDLELRSIFYDILGDINDFMIYSCYPSYTDSFLFESALSDYSDDIETTNDKTDTLYNKVNEEIMGNTL